MTDSATMTIDALLAKLRDESRLPDVAVIHRLSSLPDEEVEQLGQEWRNLPPGRKQWLLQQCIEASEADFELDYEALGEMALNDSDNAARALAIGCLWEVMTPALMRRLVNLLDRDDSEEVRAASAISLGRFVLKAELGKFPAEIAESAESLLLSICEEAADTLEVRRRALESLAYSGREEVSSLIEEAYYHADDLMRASALHAMGRSADELWGPYLLEEMLNQSPELRYEAVYALGELELEEAVPELVKLLLIEPDVEVQTGIIWALGEIGGEQALRALERASKSTENEALLDAIEDAVAAATLTRSLLDLVDPNDFEDFDDGDLL